jgi:2,4-dienoyl-CoA reductase-like NADH-dependent reductase (Old Yellow Enzyme family)
MGRHEYKIFSEGEIGNLTLPNRLVRSATWEPSIINSRKTSDEVLNLYQELAIGGVGLIVTGGFPVFQGETPDDKGSGAGAHTYDPVQIEGLGGIADVVHGSNPGCKVVAQLETGYLGAGPSAVSSPFLEEKGRPLSRGEIRSIVDCFVEATLRMKAHGFDGVQLHAAHGGLLSCFLSPYTNRRDDAYGGGVKNRARIVREIVSGAREKVGDFPILIKMNGTDYVEGGIDGADLAGLAQEVESCGVDAIEISGGMWDCLVRTEEELGFRPVPAPESHTRIKSPDKQSYFLKYAERLNLNIPVILVGGNRDVERLEEIVRGGKVDFIALCRPLISEPDLPQRWLEGRGKDTTDCISCNACLYAMYVHPGRPEPGLVRCVFKHDKQGYKMAQGWLASWVEENIVS